MPARHLRWIRAVLACLVLSSAAPSGARADQVLYLVQDLTFAIPAGQNGWPSAIAISEPGTVGHYLWTYTAGDFAGGSGTLLDLELPITSFPLSSATLTVDGAGLAGSQPGNTHDLTYDWQITFAQALQSPSATVAINSGGSAFDFTGTYLWDPALNLGTFGEWVGTITGGSLVPQASAGVGPSGGLRTMLDAPSPNPSRGESALAFTLAESGPATLEVFDVHGRRLATLAQGVLASGAHRVTWDARDANGQRLPGGLYFARLATPRGQWTQRLVRVE